MEKIKLYIKTGLLVIATIFLLTSCMKDFLDVKRDKAQVIPVTLEDYHSIFENTTMNFPSSHLLGEIGSDDLFLYPQRWMALSVPEQKNGYVWADDIYLGQSSQDWNRGYERILYANFVLEGVSEIIETSTNKALRDELIGTAHFYRGTNFFQLAQLFCKQYNTSTANGDLGLPLRVTSNINTQYQRENLEETYRLIINDLEIASKMLPNEMSLNTRPYRATAMGMLANVYLQIGDYDNAFSYADAALSIVSEILDYNEVNTSINNPFALYGRGHKEIIFFSYMTAAILLNSNLTVDSTLYDSYSQHDLRKLAFFVTTGDRISFKGSYAGNVAFMFTGLTVPELLLIKSECNARLGKIQDSVADLNLLLSNRFSPEHFEPVSNDISQHELLYLVLSERRKELIYRGRRWSDLKRFQIDPNLAKPLKRVLDEMEYNLPINSPKWVWPIPPDVISLGGIEQNER